MNMKKSDIIKVGERHMNMKKSDIINCIWW